MALHYYNENTWWDEQLWRSLQTPSCLNRLPCYYFAWWIYSQQSYELERFSNYSPIWELSSEREQMVFRIIIDGRIQNDWLIVALSYEWKNGDSHCQDLHSSADLSCKWIEVLFSADIQQAWSIAAKIWTPIIIHRSCYSTSLP